jgi:hypothetical protein
MQANNDPKWTDDAAFWNEAWADMDKRLDQPPPSRKTAVVWWRRYGWLLSLVLFVAAVATPAAMAYLSQNENMEQPPTAPKAPATPAPAPPEVIASNGSEPSSQETMITEQTSDKATATKGSSTAAAAAVSESPTSPVPANVTTSASEGIPASTSSTDDGAMVLGEQPTSSPSPANIVPNVVKTLGQNGPTSALSLKGVPAALMFLTDQPIGSIEFGQNITVNQLDVIITKPKLASRFYLDAGTSHGLKGNKTGYYAGLQYSLPISKRLSVPLGIRFRRDFHQFVELAESGTPARFLEVNNSTTSTAPDTILFEFTAANFKEVVTTGFESRIGLEYSATPRLRIGASLSVNYLQAATARVSPLSQRELADAQNNLLYADADFTLVNGLRFSRLDASFSTPNTISTGSSSNFPSFNQWVAHAEVNVSYDLTPKLSLTLSGRRLLAQPDQSKVIGLQRGQLEIGARWRLK